MRNINPSPRTTTRLGYLSLSLRSFSVSGAVVLAVLVTAGIRPRTGCCCLCCCRLELEYRLCGLCGCCTVSPAGLGGTERQGRPFPLGWGVLVVDSVLGAD